MSRKIIFVVSHPIQYFTPMYKYLNESAIPLDVWFLSDESIRGIYDNQFKSFVKWDIPMLEGYSYKFIRNISWKKSLSKGFFGLINPSLINELYRAEPSLIIVHGWHYLSNLFVLIAAKLFGHKVALRSEMPLNQELKKNNILKYLNRFLLSSLIFPRIDYFLYIGQENRKFYQFLGVKNHKLIFMPYCVDDKRFQAESKINKPRKNKIKLEFGIPIYNKVILYSGKYISKKRPEDLIKAFGLLDSSDCTLVMIGDGPLKEDLVLLALDLNIENILFTGFVNQSEISRYYSIGDVFVMCSDIGETWGLSVNEAMNFNLPVIVSDTTGCGFDLIVNGANGFQYKTGDTSDLFNKLKVVLFSETLTYKPDSITILSSYSYEAICSSIKQLTNN